MPQVVEQSLFLFLQKQLSFLSKRQKDKKDAPSFWGTHIVPMCACYIPKVFGSFCGPDRHRRWRAEFLSRPSWIQKAQRHSAVLVRLCCRLGRVVPQNSRPHSGSLLHVPSEVQWSIYRVEKILAFKMLFQKDTLYNTKHLKSPVNHDLATNAECHKGIYAMISFNLGERLLFPLSNSDMIMCQIYRAPRKIPPGFQNQAPR